MTPKEFDTQIALGTIKWYTAKQIEKALDDAREYPPDSVDKVVSETRSGKLLYHILGVYPKKNARLYSEVLTIITCHTAFKLCHALKIVASNHLYNSCSNSIVDRMIISAIRKSELEVERCTKTKKS